MKLPAILDQPAVAWNDRVAMMAYQLSKHAGELLPVRHIFKDMWYIREMELPRDIYFVGREHKEGHIVKLLRGKAALLLPDGPRDFCAPAVIHTQPGFHSVAYTYTNILVQTWHDNFDNCQDIEVLEARYFSAAQPVLERGKQLMKELSCQAQ